MHLNTRRYAGEDEAWHPDDPKNEPDKEKLQCRNDVDKHRDDGYKHCDNPMIYPYPLETLRGIWDTTT